jgi:Ran GTPase-activating protein (RanGAP) involved in mRNA processing and transport
VLRYNSFKDFSAAELSRVLLYDVYIKSIDLRNNLIKEKGVKELLNVVKTNKTILNMDI